MLTRYTGPEWQDPAPKATEFCVSTNRICTKAGSSVFGDIWLDLNDWNHKRLTGVKAHGQCYGLDRRGEDKSFAVIGCLDQRAL